MKVTEMKTRSSSSSSEILPDIPCDTSSSSLAASSWLILSSSSSILPPLSESPPVATVSGTVPSFNIVITATLCNLLTLSILAMESVSVPFTPSVSVVCGTSVSVVCGVVPLFVSSASLTDIKLPFCGSRAASMICSEDSPDSLVPSVSSVSVHAVKNIH
ncbi:hypothetical protein pdam_00000810 [Pocillopora damicornis]|uniref:Uncharacterized protein n=1 Tax=Pocillopora damicornis TaxID=46731 RepID=A0A3M6TVB5_POCDA|nr:hypothetical protein pdam_00000810 [Pocillopora damicornis]